MTTPFSIGCMQADELRRLPGFEPGNRMAAPAPLAESADTAVRRCKSCSTPALAGNCKWMQDPPMIHHTHYNYLYS